MPMLRDDFEEQGPHGVHLCLVMDILSTDVSTFRRSAPDQCLPLHMTKMIVALMVESLDSLDDLNIIHAGPCGIRSLHDLTANPYNDIFFKNYRSQTR
jgi:serine/threonine-protein kinase SRPK3